MQRLNPEQKVKVFFFGQGWLTGTIIAPDTKGNENGYLIDFDGGIIRFINAWKVMPDISPTNNPKPS